MPWTLENLHLVRVLAITQTIRLNFEQAEKTWLRSLEISERATNRNHANMLEEHSNLCRFYLVKDLHMCMEYSDSEISRIFDLKKDYEQDE